MNVTSTNRCIRSGSFTLPCPPTVALPLFTPEGERAWVSGWAPTYLSGAMDEPGAVWATDLHGVHVTWVTVIREDDHVRYAKINDNGIAGVVDVRCVADDDGTRVRVEYDVTATSDDGLSALEELDRGYDDMMLTWRDLATRALT